MNAFIFNINVAPALGMSTFIFIFVFVKRSRGFGSKPKNPSLPASNPISRSRVRVPSAPLKGLIYSPL